MQGSSARLNRDGRGEGAAREPGGVHGLCGLGCRMRAMQAAKPPGLATHSPTQCGKFVMA